MQFRFLVQTIDRFLLSFILLLSCTSIVKSQSTKQVRDSIDSLLSPWKTDDRPGLSVSVVQNGNVLYSNGVGMANIKSKMPNDSSTTFWVASVTKQFTAAAIYKLIAEKKIEPGKSIQTYLTDLPGIFKNVTVDQLIHHTSGIRDGFVLTALARNPPSAYTNDNIMHYLKLMTDLSFPVGSRFEYNNSGYVLLAMLIEKVSGSSYPAYMEQNIFHPLSMNQTYISPTFPTKQNQAQGYKHADSSFQEYHFEGNTYGSTGVITTLADLERWAMFLQNPNSVPELTKIARPLLTTGKLADGKAIAYAGGLEKFKYNGRTMYEHFGADEGFKADILYFPDTKVSVIGLANNDSYYGLLGLLCNISDLIHHDIPKNNVAIKDSKQKVSESFYYSPGVPAFLNVQNFSNYVKLSNTPEGYAAVYNVIGDTLRSLDPVPIQYLKKNETVEKLDFYYHDNVKLKRIIPSTRKDDLSGFVGEYHSPELQTSYKIMAGENGLQFEFVPGVVFDLYRITDNDFMFDYQGPNFLQFSKNGLTFSREGCRGLALKKK